MFHHLNSVSLFMSAPLLVVALYAQTTRLPHKLLYVSPHSSPISMSLTLLKYLLPSDSFLPFLCPCHPFVFLCPCHPFGLSVLLKQSSSNDHNFSQSQSTILSFRFFPNPTFYHIVFPSKNHMISLMHYYITSELFCLIFKVLLPVS